MIGPGLPSQAGTAAAGAAAPGRTDGFDVPDSYNPDAWPACWILEILARTGDCRAFYRHRRWRRVQNSVLRNQKGWCYAHLHPQEFPHLAGQLPEHVRGNTVHHLLPVRERPDLCLTEFDRSGRTLMVCLCPACHNTIEKGHGAEIKALRVDVPERW